MRDSGSRSAADIAPIGAAAQLALGAHPAAVVKVLCVAHLGAALAWLDVAHNWGIALGIGIMALIEEVVFRRWLPDWLSPRLGITRAELVSALLFALAHWPWSAAPVFLIFGFAMSSVRSAAGCLWPCVLIHAAHNAWVRGAAEGQPALLILGTHALPTTIVSGCAVLAELAAGSWLAFLVLRQRRRLARGA